MGVQNPHGKKENLWAQQPLDKGPDETRGTTARYMRNVFMEKFFPALEVGIFQLAAGAVLSVSASSDAQEGHAVVCSGKKKMFPLTHGLTYCFREYLLYIFIFSSGELLL